MSKIGGLASEIAKVLQTYTSEVTNGLEDAKNKVTKRAVKQLKASSPKLTGSYTRGWRVKRVGTAFVVYNATDYQLTHLLEYGHAKVNGGRVAARPHIRKVEQEAIEEYVKQTEQVIKG